MFCDATRSYGAVVYLRVVSLCGVFTNLLMRLTPVVSENKRKGRNGDEISLPRLGVLIGVHASNFASKELKVRKGYLWTDSECVLQWIRTTKLLPVFVENRIKEIKKETDITFCYVPSKVNLADHVTRGLTVPEIDSNNYLWWHGPEWLKLNESTWPSWNIPDLTPEELLMDVDRKTSSVIYDITNVANDLCSYLSLLMMDETKYSSLRKFLCATVYCLKYIYTVPQGKCVETRLKIFRKYRLLEKVLANMTASSIYSQEIKSAILLWIFVIQHRRFPDDIFVAIGKHRKNCLRKQLGLKLDDVGMLREIHECYVTRKY